MRGVFAVVHWIRRDATSHVCVGRPPPSSVCFISAMLLLEDMQVDQLFMLYLEDVSSIVGGWVEQGRRQVECCMSHLECDDLSNVDTCVETCE